MTVDPAGSGAPMSERMQSLLSRAVEDQLSEQRQLAGALTEVRAQLQQISADVASLREQRGDGGGSGEGALASVSAEVREAVRLLGERLDGVARLVQQRGSDLAELHAATAALQASVRGNGQALAGVTSGLQALPAFGDRIGGLQEALTALQERLAGLDELSGAIGALQQRVEAMDHGLRELRSAFAAIGARMAELPGRADLEAAAGRAEAPLRAVHDRLGALEQAVQGLPGSVADALPTPAPSQPVDSGADELRRRVDRLASAHDTAAESVERRLAGLEAQLRDVLAALTPEEAEEPVDDAEADVEEGEDPVLVELAELREALLGEDGLAARLERGEAEDLDAKVSSAVQDAVAASEQRLAAHVDEAVYALAEALLRRRTGRGAVGRPALVAPAEAPEPEAPDDSDEEQPVEELNETDETDEPDEAAQPGAAVRSTPWQTPPAEPAPPAPAREDADRRRRPWWRPGD